MSTASLYVRVAVGTLLQQRLGALALLAVALVATGSLAAIPIYDGVLRDLTLRVALDSADPSDLRVRVGGEPVALDRTTYSEAQGTLDAALSNALGGAGSAEARGGTTAPFEAYPRSADGAPATAVDLLGESALQFRSDLEAHVELLAGRFPDAMPRSGDGPIPVLVGEQSALAFGLTPGAELELRPTGAAEGPPLLVEVAGVARPFDAGEAYWGDGEAALERTADGAFTLLVPETTFFGALPELLVGAVATFEVIYAVDGESVEAGDVSALAQRVRGLPATLESLGGASVETGLPAALASAGEAPGLGRASLLLLFGQLTIAALALAAAVSARLAGDRRARHEALTIRGAPASQLATTEVLAAVPIALLAFMLGPPLAAAAVGALGQVEAFEPFSAGGWLGFELPLEAYAYAVAASVAVLAAIGASSALVAVAGRARSDLRATVRRALVGGALVALATGAAFWTLTARETLFEAQPEGVVTQQYLLLAPIALIRRDRPGGTGAARVGRPTDLVGPRSDPCRSAAERRAVALPPACCAGLRVRSELCCARRRCDHAAGRARSLPRGTRSAGRGRRPAREWARLDCADRGARFARRDRRTAG